MTADTCSVYPTRTARFGVALVDSGVLRLKNAACARDERPIDPGCSCSTCARFTRAYLHHTVTRGVASAAVLVTYHNVAYMQVSFASPLCTRHTPAACLTLLLQVA